MSAIASFCFAALMLAGTETPNHRMPANDAELRYWLENMIWHHRFSTDEIRAATGLSAEQIAAAAKRFNAFGLRASSRQPEVSRSSRWTATGARWKPSFKASR